MTGYPLEALVGQPIDRILQDANGIFPDCTVNTVHSRKDEDARHGIDKTVLRRDGTRLFVGLVSNPIREHGIVVGTVVTLKDETDRRQAEEERKKTLSLLSATLESTADGIVVVNREGEIERYNQKFVQMWNIPESIVASADDDKTLAYVLDQLKDPEGFLKNVKERYAQLDAESYDILELKDGRVFERY